MEPIAIIGFSLKFPGDADTPEGFWRMMAEKRCAMTEWPDDRMSLEAFTPPNLKLNSGAHFLKEDLGCFDAPFFGISAMEANAMDPQHRLTLETAYRALENAGIPMEKVRGTNTAVYSGCMNNDYKHIVTHDPDSLPKYTAVGTSLNMLANRVSWFFNFNGPSVNLDTACSSSLMALDMACQGLRNRDASMALVAGANAIISVESVLSLMHMNLVSPDGRCYSFDSRANGFGRGEGVGVIVIKRISDAVRDGDMIRGVIRSTGSNQDGYTRGLTQPDKDLQAQLILDTYEKAGLDLSETRFFEAHGTGTQIGDTTEASAIRSVFRNSRSAEDPLYIGAVKSNIGHLEGGSGIASVIKAISVLEKGIIPPNANFERLNPDIDAGFFNLKIPTTAIPWPSKGLRRVSIASFGFGGSNSHAILDDAYHYLEQHGLVASHCSVRDPPASQSLLKVTQLPKSSTVAGNKNTGEDASYEGDIKPRSERLCKSRVFIWSAEDEDGIKRMVDAYVQFFNNISTEGVEETTLLEQLAEYLAVNRSRLSWKAYAIADSLTSLKSLDSIISKPVHTNRALGLGYVFTGQGAQYHKMGKGLACYPVFRHTLELCEQAYRSFGCEWSKSIFELLDSTDSDFDMNDPEYAQPLTTALQIALFELLSSFGLKPSFVVGHSSGEIPAAYAAGGLSLVSACRVSYVRGIYANLLKKEVSAGAMIAVDLSASAAERYLNHLRARFRTGSIYVACENSPSNVTISGDKEMVDKLILAFKLDHVLSYKIRTGLAYHTPVMGELVSYYQDSLKDLEAGERPHKKVVMISSLTGEEVTDLDVLSTADYWVENMISPVEFHQAMNVAFLRSTERKKTREPYNPEDSFISDWIEIGPHCALQRPFRQILQSIPNHPAVRYNTAIDRRLDALKTLQTLMGNLYSVGYPVSFQQVNQTAGNLGGFETILANLPGYPFNHSRKYWHETHTTRNLRLRPHKRLELLGTPTPESTPEEARWRKFFDTNETPWILDHTVDGKPIYPASGMLVMAIEGANQLTEPTRVISGFLIHDATFTSPIKISATDRTEAQLYMRPVGHNVESASRSYEFRIYLELRGQLQETCRGIISVQFETAPSEAVESQLSLELDHLKKKWCSAEQSCSMDISPDKVYKALATTGLHYGPSFQTLAKLSWDGSSRATGEVKIFQWTAEHTQGSCESHIVHPVTLDGLGQLGLATLTKGAQKAFTDSIAITRVREAWISSSGMSCRDSRTVRAYCETISESSHGADASIFALDENGQVRAHIKHLETTSINGNQSAHQLEPRRLCHRIDWKPDVDLLTAQQLSSYCQIPGPHEEPVGEFEDLNVLLLYYAQKAVTYAKELGIAKLPRHLRKYISWLRWQLRLHETGQAYSRCRDLLKESKKNELAKAIVQRSQGTGLEGKFYVTIGQNLKGILDGTLSLIELLSRDGLAASYYQQSCHRLMERINIKKYLELLVHKNPALKILEIGAGTGSFTAHILDALTGNAEDEDSIAKFLQYEYTDITESCFLEARKRFASHEGKIAFKTLDIEQDPGVQGFELGSYDLVVSAWSFHMTKNLPGAAANARKLLKAGGKLLMVELTKPHILRDGFLFGMFPAWWAGNEAYRGLGAPVSEERWAEILDSNNFRLDSVMPDYETDVCQESSCFIATAKESTAQLKSTANPKKPVIFVADLSSQLQMMLVERIVKDHFLAEGQYQTIHINDIATITMARKSLIVVLPEIETPLLSCIQEENFFNTLRAFLCKARDVLWVTACAKDAPTFPDVHLVRGLAKVLCTENDRLSFATAALEHHAESPEIWAKHITSLICSRLLSSKKVVELDYEEYDGILHIGRATDARDLNTAVFETNNATVKTRPFQQEFPLKLTTTTPGLLDVNSLVFVEDEPYSKQELSPNEVEIEVKAVGINFRDVFVALGKLKEYNNFGCECAGVITRIGSNCGTLRPGQRACALVVGCFGSSVQCDYRQVCPIPDTMTFPVAAALPCAGVTSYYSLVNIARIRREESVLIHSGAGGTGQMAIQIAQNIGAEIFVTVGSQEKRKILQGIYYIPDDHIFYSRDTTFARHIMRMTNNRGVDVVLNSISGDGLLASWECIAPYGRFIELGKSDVGNNSKLPMIQFSKNVSFSALAVDHMCMERPELIQEPLQHVVNMYALGNLTPPWPLQEYFASKVQGVLKLMQAGNNIGKTVIRLTPTDLVQISLRHVPSYSFSFDATFVIAGGLGGLGRSAARWMASMGAKNLILLSRSGINSGDSWHLVRELDAQGICVRTPRCDVASFDSLSAALDDCQDLPPIRGCIQGTMVLQDAIFEKLTFQQWNTTIRSKFQSTKNLHNILPANLDFFILLSSLAGIVGTVSQANYAAGNAFQDAFAAYRRSIGQHAISLDLGQMGDVGFIVENAEHARNMERTPSESEIKEVEFHALLEQCCDPVFNKTLIKGKSKQHLTESGTLRKAHQVLVGLPTPADLQSKGLEPPEWINERALFLSLRQTQGAPPTNSDKSQQTATTSPGDWKAAVLQSDSTSAATAVVVAGLTQKLARALDIPAGEVDLQRPLAFQGVDSLLAVELRHWLSRAFDSDVSALDITGSSNLEDLAVLVVERSGIVKKE